MSETAADRRGFPDDSPVSSEDIYRLLVDSVRDYAIFVLDPTGRIVSWNKGAQRIKGYDSEEVIGRHYRMFYPDPARSSQDPDRQLEIAAREGRFEGEGWRIRKDGSRFWAHVVITALYAGDTLVGYGKVTGDKTREHRAQEQLRHRERQLAEAQQIAHLGSWEWVRRVDSVQWSDEMYRIAGREPGEPVTYEEYLDLVHPSDRDRYEGQVRQTAETGAPFAQEHRLIRRDGAVRWVLSRGEALRDGDGRVTGVLGTTLDITELKETEVRERRLTAERVAREQAERAARRMGFLARASALLGGSLEYEETLRTVAWLAVPAFADWCAVDIVSTDGQLERLAVAHRNPAGLDHALELGRRYPSPPDAAFGPPHVIRTGEPELHENIEPALLEAIAQDEEHLRWIRELGLRSAIIVPLRVRDRSLGALTFVTAESDRRYGREDLVIAQELAGRAGLAVENAQLHAAEREARRGAERASERTARLQAITAGLSEAVTPEAVAEVIVQQGVAALGAATGVVVLPGGDGRLEVVRSVGIPEGTLRHIREMDSEAQLPIAHAIRTGEPVLIESPSERDERYPALRDLPVEIKSQAHAVLPIRTGDRLNGALAFGYSTSRSFDVADRDFLLAIARQCAQAMERARLYETEHRAREAAEEANRAKTQFVAMMSHELRTPLSAILGYQELLSEGIVGPITELQREQLERIRASAAHLRDLINQILSLSRIEAGREEVFSEEVELGSLVSDCVLLMEREAGEKGLDLTARVPDHEILVPTDPGKVRQIVLNLLSNAIKFTEQGYVRASLEEEDEQVVIRVEDTGIGIAEHDTERVFEEFTQVDQSMTRRAGGSGLGLPVSRRLARLLGGELELASRENLGSTFTLRLPREG